MANDRERENAPKFQIIDNRLLSDEERSGKAASASSGDDKPKIEIVGGSRASEAEANEKPRLEIIGGGKNAPESASELGMEADDDLGDDLGDEPELSEEEIAQLGAELESEQFRAIEEQVGRPLTEEEKQQVREEMTRQAERVSRLEVAPILVQTITELPRFAAVHLGLIANPYTRLIARNDQEAKLAIDAFGALYDVLKTRIDPRSSAELARVLNDLRANYTRITGVDPTTPGDGPRIIR